MRAIVPSPTPPLLPIAPVLKKPRPPPKSKRRFISLPLEALLGKIHMMAEAGSGKSRWLGRCLVWQLLLHGIPCVVIDPTGGTADNLIDKLIRLPREVQERLSKRILYVDMSGKGGYVPAFPLYYRLSEDDSLHDIAQRYVEVVERLDPDLKSASVMGLNAIINLGTYSGMLLAALGYQITEAEDLIRHPDQWEGRFERALSFTPEVLPAIEFFRDFQGSKGEGYARRSESFLTKIQPFTADPRTRAVYGASVPSISWEQVIRRRQVVLLDFRHELSTNRKRFKLLWCFRYLVDYLKHRGMAGRQQPLAFVIDEITQLLGFDQEQSVMAEDIEELVSVVARNYGVYLTIAHQNLHQIASQRIRKCLMTMGVQMIGKQTDPESAELLAKYFHRYNPYQLKKIEREWMLSPLSSYEPFVVDIRTVESTPEEQLLLNSYDFMDLGRFEFLVRAPQQEGDLRAPLRRISIAGLDRGLYPDERLVAKARKLLMKRDGRPVGEVLAKIDARRGKLLGLAMPARSDLDLVMPDEGPHWSF